tara:strand:- start:148 stop:339 length:192 start_codon:yes stop_codon:yes gene_type:complete
MESSIPVDFGFFPANQNPLRCDQINLIGLASVETPMNCSPLAQATPDKSTIKQHDLDRFTANF